MIAMTPGEWIAFGSLAFAVVGALVTAGIMHGNAVSQLRAQTKEFDRLWTEVNCLRKKGRRALIARIKQAAVIEDLARRMRVRVDKKALIGGSGRNKRARRAERDGAGCTQQQDGPRRGQTQ